jgi:Tfp pilus assembly protein PilN
MELRKWWEDKLGATRVAGAEIVLQGGALSLSYAVVEKKGSKLGITVSGSAGSLEGLDVLCGMPACISISGKGIIHKRVSCNEDKDTAVLLHKVLPNAMPGDFYVQHTQPLNGHAIVSVARKAMIDELLGGFGKNKMEVVACSFGPFGIGSILPAMNLNETVAEELRLPGHTITIVDGQVENYVPADNNESITYIKVGDDDINASLIVAFSAAAGYFTGNELSAGIDSVSEQAEEYRQKKIFRLAGAGLLIFLFALLLGNYLVFDHYWTKKQELEAKVSSSQGALQEYEKLKMEYDEKMKFLYGSGLLDASRSSFYADRIAADIPAGIQLTEMSINPRVKQAGDENSMIFETKLVHIQGSCRQSSELNEWIKAIRKKEWVSNVELINYKQGKPDPAGEFIIDIKVK